MINSICQLYVIRTFYGYKTIFVFSRKPKTSEQILAFKKILGGGTYNPFNKFSESGPHYANERTILNHLIYRTIIRPDAKLTRIKLLSNNELDIKFLGWRPKRILKGFVESFRFD